MKQQRNGVWRPKGCAVYMMKLSVDGQVTGESTGKRTEEEAQQVRRAYAAAGCECVIRFMGEAGGGD